MRFMLLVSIDNSSDFRSERHPPTSDRFRQTEMIAPQEVQVRLTKRREPSNIRSS